MAAFVNWPDVMRHLASRHRSIRPLLGRAVVFETPESVEVRALHFFSGTMWLAISTPVGALDALSLRGSLVANRHLPLGALAHAGGERVVLRQTVPLESPPSLVDWTIDTLLGIARGLRESASAPGDRPYAYVFR